MNDDDQEREKVELPYEVELPRMLDFYELQRETDTQIHEFYDNLRDGEFTTTRCNECDELHFPPRIVCPQCMSDDLRYEKLPHEGRLYAFSTVRGGAPLGMNDDVPFLVGLVEVGDLLISARIDGAEYEDLSIGDRVELKIVEVDGPVDHERVFYRFEPIES
ncbi:MAG: OB-fold domain-containing protein [Halobacteria archaeon]|nr:OB-fold domain-containing protein [Halobacteria archaeon]